MLGDSINQESSEKSIREVIDNSNEIKKYLEFDEVSIDELDDISKFTIVENKKSKLCVDRLDGVLSTCFIWIKTISLDEIKEIYNDMEVLTNEENELEIGFKSKEIAEKFFKCSYDYSIALQKHED